MGIFMYKCQNNLVPESITKLYTTVDNIHSYQTRSSDSGDLHVPRVIHSCAQKSISYSGAKIWNDIPVEVRKAQSIYIFKRKLREHYVRIQNQNIS